MGPCLRVATVILGRGRTDWEGKVVGIVSIVDCSTREAGKRECVREVCVSGVRPTWHQTRA